MGRLDALPDVDGAVELGAFFGFEERGWQTQIAFAQGVSGSHDSTSASDGYMGHYFTVDTGDALSAE